VNRNRVAVIIGSRFPTNKAYGVTYRETLKVLLNESFTVKIYCVKGRYFDKDFAELSPYIHNYNQNLLSKLTLKIGEQGTGIVNQIFWVSSLVMNLFLNFKHFKLFNPTIIWTRDPLIALFCARKLPSTKIVLEIHSKSSRLILGKLKKYQSRIYFFPINYQNDMFLKSCIGNAVSDLAPMGIRTETLATKYDVDTFLERLASRKWSNLNVGYVGKFSTQGYSKGVEDLIELARLFQFYSMGHRITVIGIPENQIQKLIDKRNSLKIKAEIIQFEEHVSHTDALIKMKSFDILILTLPNNQIYNGMPLKLLEYLASGRITIAARSDLVQRLFLEKFQPYFYESGNAEDLLKRISTVQRDQELSTRILNGIFFASKYSWESRTKKILLAIELDNK